jgi:hypothetical protein
VQFQLTLKRVWRLRSSEAFGLASTVLKHWRRSIAMRRKLAPSSSRRSYVSYSATDIPCAASQSSWRSARCRHRAAAHGILSWSNVSCSGTGFSEIRN